MILMRAIFTTRAIGEWWALKSRLFWALKYKIYSSVTINAKTTVHCSPDSSMSSSVPVRNVFPKVPAFKGAQAWDIRERVFYWNQTCTDGWLWDWRKKNEFSQVGVFSLRFSLRISYYAYAQHALNNSKNFKKAKNKKFCEMP